MSTSPAGAFVAASLDVRPTSIDPAALPGRFPGDQFLRWQLSLDGAGGVPAGPVAGGVAGAVAGGVYAGWVAGDAWARLDDVADSLRLVVGGAAPDAAELVAGLVPGTVRPERVSVARGAVDLLPPALRPVGGDDWDWFWTTSAPTPRLPAEELVVRLDASRAEVAAELGALLSGHSPRFSRDPGVGDAQWWGLREPGGGLVAAVAAEPLPTAVHLASLVTRTDRRGRGLAPAVLGAVIRAELAAGREAVVLGMYADNDVARRLYRRLGFVDSHAWRSGRIPAAAADGRDTAGRGTMTR